MAGLVGFRASDGRLICVDCDAFPPDCEDVREGDLSVSARCAVCGELMADVAPLSRTLRPGREEQQ